MTNNIEDEVKRIVARMDNEELQGQEQDTNTEKPQEEIQDIYVLIVREREEEEELSQVVDSTPIIPQQISFMPAYAICSFYLFLLFSCIAFQVYALLNPPIATVTIISKSQTVTLSGTLQLGRVLQPLTISQSDTVSTTGKGHQDAKQATGFITFYNGLFTSQTIQAGTILTGTDSIQVVTDQEAIIPAGNPPSYGYITVSAHAINPGVRGNILAYDISQACCSSAVLAKNTNPFIHGQDERNFQTVAKHDIDTISTPLKTAVMQSMNGALQSHLTPQEHIYVLPCTPTQTSDHPIGAEAIQVKIAVSETCSAVAFNSQELERKATDLLKHHAEQKIGTGYSFFGNVQVSVKQATIQKNVIVSFRASGTWIYALSYSAQQHIKELIAGKTKSVALRELLSLSGVERAVISWGDDTRLPKNSRNIHIRLFVV